MKSKKGISIGRVLLYILFLSLIVLFVYTLFITFRSMKKKTDVSSSNSSLKFAYNNQFDYSGADYIISAYATFYKNTDFVSSYNNGNFQFDLFSSQVMPYYNNGWVSYTNQGYSFGMVSPVGIFSSPGLAVYPNSSTGSFYNQSFTPYISDNDIQLKPLLTDIVNFDLNNTSAYAYYNYNNSYMSGGYYTHMNTNYSMMLWFDCNIPIDYFNFSFNGQLNRAPIVYYIDDSSNDVKYAFGNTWHFEKSFLNASTIQNATKIIKFGLPVLQSSSSTGLSSYLLSFEDNYLPNYQSGIINQSNDYKITFDVYTGNSSYQEGYQAGYTNGLHDVEQSLRDSNNSLIEQVNSLNGDIQSLSSLISQQQITIDNLQTQLNATNNNFKGLFFTMADIPFRTVHNALGFEFWGVNLFRFFIGAITALGIVWLIKRIL